MRWRGLPPQDGKERRGSLACALAIAGCMLLAGCAQQRIRDESRSQLADGQYEQAVSVLEAGLKEHPDSTLLRSGLIQARSDALARLVAEATNARAEGRLDDAEKTLRRALAFDSTRRVQGLLDDIAVERRQRKALTDAQALLARKQPDAAARLVTEALKDNPRQPELQALQRRLAAETRERQVLTQSGLAESRPISLDFRDAGLRAVLDAVSRHSGVNFVFDKDIRSDIRVTVYMRSARVEDALDLIVSTNQLAKKVLDERTVLIYPHTPEKQREHQEHVVKVFYLASSDAKGAAAFLRSMLRLRDPFVDERLNLLALRESPENIALAEKLIALYDGQEPEVLLEVEVLEVRTSRLTDLGIKFPDSFTLTPFPPAGSTSLTLGNVERLTRDDIRLGIGATTVNLKRQVGDFHTLANPRIRARNREKAKVMIGDKVPVVTTTAGQGGFVAESVSYLDVGLKLDVEPTVYADDDVAIRVALEVSTIAREIQTATGTLAYQIGTRNASTMLRLRDGETQLLAGLISREDRSSASRVPGLGDLPVMGRLFSSQTDDSQRTELVLAITPRIIRNVRTPDASESEVWVGTETQPRLRPYGGRLPGADAAAAAAAAPERAAAGSAGSAAAPVLAAPRPAAAPAPTVKTQWRGPQQVAVGDTFVVTLDVDATVALRGGPVQLAYSKERLALVDVQQGEFLRQGGAVTAFSQSVAANEGTARAAVLRSEASGVTGSGTLLQLRFKAMAAGDAELRLAGFEAVTLGEGAATPQGAAPLRIQVKP